MKIYNYNPETFEYVGTSTADADPLVIGTWLIPANATTEAPLDPQDGKTVHFENGTWIYKDVPDPEPEEVIPPYEPTYADLRSREYPPMSDYLDGVVKGDQAQIDKYIADCLAVKAKYPKGTS